MDNAFTSIIVEDPKTGDAVIVLPEEIIAVLKLEEGDVIDWSQAADGTIRIQKATF